jgi:small subunit ribosomal protein S21
MAKVTAKNYEKFDQLLRRFKRSCDNDKIVIQARENEFYEKPTNKRKKAKQSAIKRQAKKVKSENEKNDRKY